MSSMVEIPLWLLLIVVGFALLAALEKVMIPSVRWFFRRRMEKAVERLNRRLDRPIEPFKLARRHDMIQRLIYDPEVSQAVVEHAREQKIPENVAFEQAHRYAREIVPSFSASLYFGVAMRMARKISTALYRVRLGNFEEKALTEIDPDATVVFVMNHRSNMDYVLVTYLAAERSTLSYAVGEWARVWPLSRMIRAMGAYFIRRKSRNALYRRVLARYVRLATDAGVTQAVFPEGGLSLDGAIAPPRLGILKYMVEGGQKEGRDVVFVPVGLNYDRVLEDHMLVAAGQAGVRRFPARISVVARFWLKQVWLRLRGKYHRFGYAAVSFGAPVSLKSFQSQNGNDVEALGAHLLSRISEEVPVLPVPLIASVFVHAKDNVTRAEIKAQVEQMLGQMPKAHIHVPRDDWDYAIEVGLRSLLERKLVHKTNKGYGARDAGKPLLGYYAASIEQHVLHAQHSRL